MGASGEESAWKISVRDEGGYEGVGVDRAYGAGVDIACVQHKV